jgi:four helix bundle protein
MNPLKEKSVAYSIRMVKAYKYILNKNEFIMSKQLLRSGTSIGANIHEAQHPSSTADFVNKLRIAQKECEENIYWLLLLKESEYLDERGYNSLLNDAEELMKLISSSIKTSLNKKPG